jgi:hypothetical protein
MRRAYAGTRRDRGLGGMGSDHRGRGRGRGRRVADYDNDNGNEGDKKQGKLEHLRTFGARKRSRGVRARIGSKAWEGVRKGNQVILIALR